MRAERINFQLWRFVAAWLVSPLMASLAGGCATIPSPEPATMGSHALSDIGTDRPPTARTLYAMARLLSAQGRQNEYEHVLIGLNREHPKFMQAYVDLAEMYLAQKRNREALDALRAGLAIEPKNPTLRNNAGLCRLLLGDYQGALRDFSTVIELRPGNARYRANLALAFGLLGREKDSQAQYQQVIPGEAASFNLTAIASARSAFPKLSQQRPEATDSKPRGFTPRSDRTSTPGVQSETPSTESRQGTSRDPSTREKANSASSPEDRRKLIHKTRSTLISIERDGKVVSVFGATDLRNPRPISAPEKATAPVADEVKIKRASKRMKARVRKATPAKVIASAPRLPPIFISDRIHSALRKRTKGDDSPVVAGDIVQTEKVSASAGPPERAPEGSAPVEKVQDDSRLRGDEEPATDFTEEGASDAEPMPREAVGIERPQIAAAERPVLPDLSSMSVVPREGQVLTQAAAPALASTERHARDETAQADEMESTREGPLGETNRAPSGISPETPSITTLPTSNDGRENPAEETATAAARLDEEGLAIGEMAPGIYRLDIRDRPRPLKVQRGKVVVVGFWRHRSDESESLYPQLRELAERHVGDTFHMLGVGSGASRTQMKKIIQAEGMNWPVCWDETIRGNTAERWKVTQWPSTFVIDHRGIVRFKDLTGESLDMAVKDLLEELDRARSSDTDLAYVSY